MAKHDTDPVLKQLVQAINESGQAAVPVTVSVHGTLLNGALIAERRYFSELAAGSRSPVTTCTCGPAPAGGEDDRAAVRTVMAVSAEHHEREERYVLPGCVLGLDMNQRKELGRQWCAFMAAWSRDGARPSGTPHQPV